MRRLETQADCFSGMFVRAVSQSIGVQQQDEGGILEIYVAIGDDTLSGKSDVVGNHGLARSRKYWGTVGLRTSAVAPCNTFIAPSEARALAPFSSKRASTQTRERGGDCRDAFATTSKAEAISGGRRMTNGCATASLITAPPRHGVRRAWDGHRSAGRQRWRCSKPAARTRAAVSVRKAAPGASDHSGSVVP